mgnify:CR=1 FL=1
MDTDCAQMGQAPCPYRASTLPMWGKHVAPSGHDQCPDCAQNLQNLHSVHHPQFNAVGVVVGHQALLGIVVLSARICQEYAYVQARKYWHQQEMCD